jgi:anti-anti-sigma regulatory factor
LNEPTDLILSASVDHPSKVIVLDMSILKVFGQRELDALQEVQRLFFKSKRVLRLAAMNRDVRSAFSVTRLDREFDIYDSVEDGLDAPDTMRRSP